MCFSRLTAIQSANLNIWQIGQLLNKIYCIVLTFKCVKLRGCCAHYLLYYVFDGVDICGFGRALLRQPMHCYIVF